MMGVAVVMLEIGGGWGLGSSSSGGGGGGGDDDDEEEYKVHPNSKGIIRTQQEAMREIEKRV